MYQSDPYADLKRKIRHLKKMEQRIRSEKCKNLVWDEFFDLHDVGSQHVKYPMQKLTVMDKDMYKNVVDEYFFYVYFQYYRENRFLQINVYDPELLNQLGLPYDADANMVKQKFRELAKKYHPDAGGDGESFVKLMDQYQKLME